ncbi:MULTISPECIES: Flp pilus assembly protein CpaB [Roseobacteraceae]|jgi:pilus assembly protein CpaB|uniref:Flp pilus assembly protein RcpC/CpaB n=1 Tax=Pseudosulfitobacter pseudonitzschiae TaxID=1402135 RepID=A0A221K1V5_9RHOB|nr:MULTISPECIES: Flp pilus assembly protein CpaB [Roseobacteraceae]ASM72978.1 Flp pilus assembly protein RcpC/CpaB [Pseudosulfitobacter pseudonitzschiae]
MRVVFGLVLIVGFALAGGAVYMAKNYIGAYQTELAKERQARAKIVPTVEVYVADRALKYGEAITDADVRTVQWPVNAIPEGAFAGDSILWPEGQPNQRVVLRAMEKDEAILAVKVTEPGVEAGLTSRLERGMRAFAIKVDVASGVSGFLRPDDRVDVYWTGQVGRELSSDSGEVTKLIEAGVKLIAIDQSAAGDLDGAVIAQTVTVAVKPAQVAALAQAQATGRLALSLVGADDDTVAGAIEIDQRTLLGIETKAAAAEVKAAEVCTIRTRRGAEVVEIPIPCTN